MMTNVSGAVLNVSNFLARQLPDNLMKVTVAHMPGRIFSVTPYFLLPYLVLWIGSMFCYCTAPHRQYVLLL